jgi:hypothetical protein
MKKKSNRFTHHRRTATAVKAVLPIPDEPHTINGKAAIRKVKLSKSMKPVGTPPQASPNFFTQVFLAGNYQTFGAVSATTFFDKFFSTS